MFAFEVTQTAGGARLGRLTTPHGTVDTPVFMPVGTAGTVKGITPSQLRATDTRMILANTYHLQLRPTADAVRELGGLHAFTGWDGPILTDSGGYQVFSLAKISRITDEGVEFQSHIDGTALRLDPRTATDIQNKLGADVIMAFDECPSLPCTRAVLETAVKRTVRWACECKKAHTRGDQALFGIVQGGLDLDLRRRCAAEVIHVGFDGYAIGGLSVGETHEEMAAVLGPIAEMLPTDRPRYLMGVGMPRDILEAVKAGVDMFDCVLPTRNARNGQVFTSQGKLAYKAGEHREALDRPLDPGCDCFVCKNYSLGYLRHLFNCGELTALRLASYHNLYFYLNMMRNMRKAILRDEFSEWKARFTRGLARNGRETADRSDDA
jgi:queuine tRNA-ribosyltransferase